MTTIPALQRLRPSILVVLRTRIEGAVRYYRTDIERDHAEGESRVAKWETTRIIEDPKEHEEAVKVRGRVINLVRSACTLTSAFGLMSPLSNSQKLEEKLREARTLLTEFNGRARTCRVIMQTLRGEIATDDAEAARAVLSEIGRQVAEMRKGIKAADPKAIRKAADEAKALSAVLTDDAREKAGSAIEAARKAAREITKRVVKAGEVAKTVIKDLDTRALMVASRTFIDLDEAAPAPATPLAPVAAAVDLPAVEKEV